MNYSTHSERSVKIIRWCTWRAIPAIYMRFLVLLAAFKYTIDVGSPCGCVLGLRKCSFDHFNYDDSVPDSLNVKELTAATQLRVGGQDWVSTVPTKCPSIL